MFIFKKILFVAFFILLSFSLINLLGSNLKKSLSSLVAAQSLTPALDLSGLPSNPAPGSTAILTVNNCPSPGYILCNNGGGTYRCPTAPLTIGPGEPNPDPDGDGCFRATSGRMSCNVRFPTGGSVNFRARCAATSIFSGGFLSATSPNYTVADPGTSPVPSDDPETTIPPSDPNTPPGQSAPEPPTPTPTPPQVIICHVCDDEYRHYVKAINSCCKTRDCAAPGLDRSQYVKPATAVECEIGKEFCYDGRGCNVLPAAKDPPCYDTAGNPIEDIDGVCPQVKLGDASIPGLFLSTNAADFIGQVLGILLSVSGMVAVALIIRSGYQYMTSRGNPDAIQEARDRLTSAIIGLLFIIFSLVILQVIGVDILKIPGFTN